MTDEAVSQRVTKDLECQMFGLNPGCHSGRFLQQLICMLSLWVKETAMEGDKDRGKEPSREPSLEGNLQFYLHKGLGQQGQEVKGQVSLTCLRVTRVSCEWKGRVWVVAAHSGALVVRGFSRIVGALEEKLVGVWRWGCWIWPLKGSSVENSHAVKSLWNPWHTPGLVELV